MTKKINRRQLMRVSVIGSMGVLTAACTRQGETPSTPINAAPDDNGAAYASKTSAPITANPSTSTAATSASLVKAMADAANQFLNTLDDAQRTKATYAFTDNERLRWHWTTTSTFPRNGLPLRDMQPKQHEAALALLRAGLSEAGFKKSLDIMQLQPEIGGDPENYYVTVFGKPSDPAWGWRFEGHHLSRRFTIAGDKVTITPFFHGVWPTISAAGKTIMQREEWAARELMKSLDTDKRSAVIVLPNAPGRHLTWNDNYVKPFDPAGAPLSTLDNTQQALAMEIIHIWMNTQADAVAKAHLDRINTSSLDNIRFGWAGALEERRPHYYRIQGPSFLMEYDNSRNGATHIHSVWRVFDQDFGQGLA